MRISSSGLSTARVWSAAKDCPIADLLLAQQSQCLPYGLYRADPSKNCRIHIAQKFGCKRNIALNEAYRERKLSTAQLRRLLGFETRYELDGFLKAHQVWLEYTAEDLERDREAHHKLGL
jgi:hypothetical protein